MDEILIFMKAFKLELKSIKKYASIFIFLYLFILLFAFLFTYTNSFDFSFLDVNSQEYIILASLIFFSFNLFNVSFALQNLDILSNENIIDNFFVLFKLSYPFYLKYFLLLFGFVVLALIGLVLMIIPFLFILPVYYLAASTLIFYDYNLKDSSKKIYHLLKTNLTNTMIISFAFTLLISLLTVGFAYLSVILFSYILIFALPLLFFIINSFSTSLFLYLNNLK